MIKQAISTLLALATVSLVGAAIYNDQHSDWLRKMNRNAVEFSTKDNNVNLDRFHSVTTITHKVTAQVKKVSNHTNNTVKTVTLVEDLSTSIGSGKVTYVGPAPARWSNERVYM